MSESERVRRSAKAERFKGSIVNFASICGFKSLPGVVGSYTVSKHGMIGMTKAMGTQYGSLGVRTNAVCPGYVRNVYLSGSMLMEFGVLKIDIHSYAVERFSGS